MWRELQPLALRLPAARAPAACAVARAAAMTFDRAARSGECCIACAIGFLLLIARRAVARRAFDRAARSGFCASSALKIEHISSMRMCGISCPGLSASLRTCGISFLEYENISQYFQYVQV